MTLRLTLAITSVFALAGCVAVVPVTLESPTPAQYTEEPTRLTVEIGPELVSCRYFSPITAC